MVVLTICAIVCGNVAKSRRKEREARELEEATLIKGVAKTHPESVDPLQLAKAELILDREAREQQKFEDNGRSGGILRLFRKK